MATLFQTLPPEVAGAARNMALDLALLEEWPDGAVRFRAYGWARPAFTCGLSQSWAEMRALADAAHGPEAELVRRPTGGGLVDHRDDWTYALALPPAVADALVEPRRAYALIHRALAEALAELGLATQLNPCPRACGAAPAPLVPRECFVQASADDVMLPGPGAKVAGAALKRSRLGLLAQGSADRRAAPPGFPWAALGPPFAARLAAALGTDAPAPAPWPEVCRQRADGLTERFAAPDWNERR